LDYKPFDQAIEDKFRGVDGRGVSDEDMFNPPEEMRPKRLSEELMKEHQRNIEERKRKREEQKRNGVKIESNAVCGLRKSNYNLDPI
jgi:hypothetical protein